MLRTFVCAAIALTLVAGVALTEEKKVEGKLHKHKAWFVSADQTAKPPTVTFKVKLKDGKEKEMTLPLAADAKLYGEKHDNEKLDMFAAKIQKEKDKAIMIVEDKDGKHIVEIDDLPPAPDKPAPK